MPCGTAGCVAIEGAIWSVAVLWSSGVSMCFSARRDIWYRRTSRRVVVPDTTAVVCERHGSGGCAGVMITRRESASQRPAL